MYFFFISLLLKRYNQLLNDYRQVNNIEIVESNTNQIQSTIIFDQIRKELNNLNR
jgi:hypothetical protein